jgi:hypothetical protein
MESDGMKRSLGFRASCLTLLLVLFAPMAFCMEELYIITTSQGAEIVVRDYHFSGDTVQYTTKDGLQGTLRKKDFLSISNMVGVQPGQAAQSEQSAEQQHQREIMIWIGAVALIVVLYLGYLAYVARGRGGSREKADIHYGRIEKEPTTHGHLAFTYRGLLGRKSSWTIDVRRAYAEDDILFVEGICTTSGRKKIFRADRVVGQVMDRSSERQALMEHFFIDAKER